MQQQRKYAQLGEGNKMANNELDLAMEALLPILGKAASKKIADELGTLGGKVGKAWQKEALVLLAHMVETHGPEGLNKAKDVIDDIFEGKAPDLSGMSLRAASDFMAGLQLLEAEGRTETQQYLQAVSESIAAIAAAVLKGVLLQQINKS